MRPIGCSSIKAVVAGMAPEVLGSFANPDDSITTAAADVWAAGCFLVDLLLGGDVWGTRAHWEATPSADGHEQMLAMPSNDCKDYSQLIALVQHQHRVWVSSFRQADALAHLSYI